MTRFVIDAATLLAVPADGGTFDPAHQLVAPASVRSQALELLLGRVRAGELAERDALALHTRLTETRLRLLNDRVSRRAAWDLALAQGWNSLRDAEYLALVRLQADALVTVDERLAGLARGLVPIADLRDVLASPG